MKKVMLLAAMLAMVLAAAAPAMGQGNVLSENAVGSQVGQGNVQCVQNASQDSAQLQYAPGAVGGGHNISIQAIAQECNISPAAVTTVLGATATPTAAAAAQYQYASPTATATATALPPTGGSVPFSGALALGAGALLMAGGLLARRIVR